jgi:threonine dehydrogenase-like Zn-dependent dehydrogenase
MKAAVFVEKQRIIVEERSKPVADPGEVVVAVSHCGICGSDIHGYLNGIVIKPGTVMGHECTGTISQVGEGAGVWSIGDRVAVKPMAECGTCHYCCRGQLSLCTQAVAEGIGLVPGRDGAFASHIRIRHPGKMLFRLPDEVSFEEAVFTESLATSLHGVRRSGFRPGDSAVVIGAGTIGLGVIQFLRIGGARRIIVLEPSTRKRELALKMKADMVLDPMAERSETRRRVYDFTWGLGADHVFECAGASQALQTSYGLARRGGQVMLIGVSEKEVSIKPLLLCVREVSLRGVFGYYDEFPMVIDFIQQGKIDTASMLSDVIPLEQIEDRGFRRLAGNPDLVKIAVVPDNESYI